MTKIIFEINLCFEIKKKAHNLGVDYRKDGSRNYVE